MILFNGVVKKRSADVERCGFEDGARRHSRPRTYDSHKEQVTESEQASSCSVVSTPEFKR